MPPRLPSPSANLRLPTLDKGEILRVDFPNPQGSPGNEGQAPTGFVSRGLTFQYNPESITRTRAGRWEPRAKRNQKVDKLQDVTSRSGSGAAQLLAESETISFKVTFDATEQRLLGGHGNDGILPELAFLELVSLGRIIDPKNTTAGKLRSVRPDNILLRLGVRVFPVILTNLTITEQKFTPDLVPIRAEVDLKFTVLEPVDVSLNQWVADAFNELVRQRSRLAQQIGDASAMETALTRALEPARSVASPPAQAAPASEAENG